MTDRFDAHVALHPYEPLTAIFTFTLGLSYLLTGWGWGGFSQTTEFIRVTSLVVTPAAWGALMIIVAIAQGAGLSRTWLGYCIPRHTLRLLVLAAQSFLLGLTGTILLLSGVLIGIGYIALAIGAGFAFRHVALHNGAGRGRSPGSHDHT